MQAVVHTQFTRHKGTIRKYKGLRRRVQRGERRVLLKNRDRTKTRKTTIQSMASTATKIQTQIDIDDVEDGEPICSILSICHDQIRETFIN